MDVPAPQPPALAEDLPPLDLADPLPLAVETDEMLAFAEISPRPDPVAAETDVLFTDEELVDPEPPEPEVELAFPDNAAEELSD